MIHIVAGVWGECGNMHTGMLKTSRQSFKLTVIWLFTRTGHILHGTVFAIWHQHIWSACPELCAAFCRSAVTSENAPADWYTEAMAGCSAWVIGYGLKWHLILGGKGLGFFQQQNLSHCCAWFQKSACFAIRLRDRKRQKPGISYSNSCCSLILPLRLSILFSCYSF